MAVMSTSALLAKSLLTVALIIIQRQSEHNSLVKRNTFDSEYDFIIIGAGTAGSVVAARLSEHHNFKVLLVEAGSAESVVSDMPTMLKSLWGSEMDWNYELSAQSYAFNGYNGRSTGFSQGRVMGGSSTINAMAYARGLSHDFDAWSDYGVEGWSWKEVLPYFIMSENNTDPRMNDTFHGRNGALSVSSMPESDAQLIHRTTIDAAKQLGYREIDLNDPNELDGVAVQQMTIRDGSRCTTSKAYLQPIASVRTNLHILANTVVKLINFDSDRKAVSVIIDRSGKESIVGARKEIIVSAGAINTAKLLMLSGIGLRSHLEELNIPVIADLPVGLNYHDNPIVFGIHFTINATKESKDLMEKDITEFFMDGSGRLTQAYKPVLRVTTKYSNQSDAQIFVSTGSPADFENEEIAESAMNLRRDVWTAFYKPYSGESTLTLTPLLNRPKSRGYVQLRSRDANEAPIINPNCFADNTDLNTMVEAMKIALKLGETDAFLNAFYAKPFATRVPNCSTGTLDEYLSCVAKSLTNTYTHSAGTCRMGAVNDTRESVVSSLTLRVHTVRNVRVVDTSVVPQSPSGALYATAVMIGERGAQFILDDYLAIGSSCSPLISFYSHHFLMAIYLFLMCFLLFIFTKTF